MAASLSKPANLITLSIKQLAHLMDSDWYI
jgi:hypothetical protein